MPRDGFAASNLQERYAQGERDFRGIDLTEAQLDGVKLPGANLDGSNLSGAKMQNANLSRVSFRNANLEGAQLSNSNLNEAVLDSSRLKGAKLIWADLTRASLAGVTVTTTDKSLSELPALLMEGGTDFTHATLIETDLRKARLTGASLRHARLWGTDLTDASLDACDMEQANFMAAILIRADLKQANLKGTTIVETDFKDALLGGVDFSDADLAGARNLRLDSCSIRGARFSQDAGKGSGDPWSQLRREYTGVMTSIHLLLLVIFFSPYVTEALWWRAVGGIEVATTQASDELARASGEARREAVAKTSAAADMVGLSSEQKAKLLQRLETPGPTDAAARCGGGPCTERAIGGILLGYYEGWWTVFFRALLIAYNLGRGFLTWGVGLLVSQEERSGLSPRWIDYQRYSLVHRWGMRWLGVLAVSYFLWHTVQLLMTTVLMPVGR